LTNFAGERVGFGRASARYFASWISGDAMVDDEESIEAKPPGDDATDSDVGVTSVIGRDLPGRGRSDNVQAAEGAA